MIRQIFTLPIRRRFTADGIEDPDANHAGYVVVEADNYEHARELMWARFGNGWAFQYPDEERAGVERWGLVLVETLKAGEREA